MKPTIHNFIKKTKLLVDDMHFAHTNLQNLLDSANKIEKSLKVENNSPSSKLFDINNVRKITLLQNHFHQKLNTILIERAKVVWQ
jgi:hypothetical protein